MKKLIHVTLISLCILAPAINANEHQTQVYVNQNIGFNVPGYKYEQSEFPCNIDKTLVNLLIEKGTKANLKMEAVLTTEEINNDIIPVLLIDIEQLALGQKYTFGTKTKSNLPKVQVTAGILKGKGMPMETAKHTCAIATLNELTTSTDVLDLGHTGTTVCSATKRCLQYLSKDIIEWLEPQVK